MNRCGNCKFFVALASECHAKPPNLIPIPQADRIGFLGVWPPTKDTNWCGAHEGAPPNTTDDSEERARQ